MGPGWDKIFNFVGANTSAKIFADATEGVQYIDNLGIKYKVDIFSY